MERSQGVYVDKNPPIEFAEARRAWRDVIRRQGAPMLEMNPADYDTIGKLRKRQGRNNVCQTCGGAQFIRFTWPLEHPYFGRPVKCPACNR